MSKRDKITRKMSVEMKQMSAPAEMPPSDDDYHEEEPFYHCAYCNTDQGHDFMEQMCADCYWEWDSLLKSTGRTSRLLVLRENASEERQKEIISWIQDDKRRLREFEEKLEAGQERIHRELEIYEVYGKGGFGESNPYREANDAQFASAGAGAGATTTKDEPKPKTLMEMTENEINNQLFTLDEELKLLGRRTALREMTPQESDEYAAMERAAQACVDELLRRRK